MTNHPRKRPRAPLYLQIGDSERIKVATIAINEHGLVDPRELAAVTYALAAQVESAVITGSARDAAAKEAR
jgi:hypothetical protein